MASEQVRDVLSNTQRLHEHAKEYFSQLARHCDDTRKRLLLEYLSDHEGHLASTIEQITADAETKVLDTWVRSSMPVTRLVDQWDWDNASKGSADFEGLLDLGLQIDDRVIEVYGELAQRADPPWLQDVFQDLLEMEQQEEKQVTRQALRGEEM